MKKKIEDSDATQAMLIIDEGNWSYLSGEAKVCSNTSSFSFPMIADEVVDVENVFVATKTPMS